MEIVSGAKIIGKALFFSEKRILAIADLHIGYENMLNERGVLVPRAQFREMMNDLKKVFDEIEKKQEKAKEIVILGDLKHDFGRISKQEWKETLALLDFLKKKCKKIVLIKGNHDAILEPIARQKGIELRDFYIKDDICFMHGHKIFAGCLSKGIKTIVLGHGHPAIVLRDKIKSERYKCFLAGKWKGKQIIILPSFFPLVEGSDISMDFENGLAFNFNLKNFKVYAIGDKVYEFGKVKSINLL